MAQLAFDPLATALDDDGAVISGAKAYFYRTGTTTAASTYSDAGLSVPNTQPVVADSAGRFAPIYLDPAITYKVVVKDADSVVIRSVDPLFNPLFEFSAAVAAAEAAQAAAIALQAEIEAASETALSDIASASLAAIFASTADALSKGVASVSGLVGGTGGTNGTFALAFSGGAGSGAAGVFVVAGGIVTSTVLTASGRGYTSAPTISFAASSGLSGASATAVIANNVDDGEFFEVAGTGDEYAVLYQNVSGVAVERNRRQSLTGALAEAELVGALTIERSPSVVPALPNGVIVNARSIDAIARSGRDIPNRTATHSPPNNIFAKTSLDIEGVPQSGAVSTKAFANGPAGHMTAERVQMSNGQYRRIFGGVLPAGTWKFGLQFKSNTGGGSQTFKFGDFNTTNYTSVTSTEAGYVQSTYTFTSDGVTALLLLVIRNTSGSVDILMDELQGYSGTVLPAYSSEYFDGHVRPNIAVSGALTLSGYAVDTTSGAVLASIQFNTFPSTKTFAAATGTVCLSTTDTATAATKVFGSADLVGQFECGNDGGLAFGGPAAPFQSGLRGLYMAAGDYHVLTSRWSANEATFYFHGIPVATKLTANAPITLARFNAFSDSDGGFPFKGKVTVAPILHDVALSDDQVMAEYLSVRSAHAIYNEAPIKDFNFLIVEGDSLSAGFGQGPEPPTNGSYFDQFFATHPAGYYGVKIAVGGAGMADVQTRLSNVLRQCRAAVASGKRPIYSVLIGANGIPPIADYIAVWDAVRATGAKVIAMTVTPWGGQTAFNAQAAALNVDIRAASAHYDALLDLALDTFMSNPANTTYYQSDQRHWTNAGGARVQTLIEPVWAALGLV